MGEVEDVDIVVDNDGDDDNKDSIEDDYEHVDEDEEFGINGENDDTMYCPPSHFYLRKRISWLWHKNGIGEKTSKYDESGKIELKEGQLFENVRGFRAMLRDFVIHEV
uniref:Uncharacterized protein n=1 Tax=Vitis vinifera TaxID=29760 RepID=A5B2L5_VITVI|nr:hypothetical protein VITISV_015321 [Vitis vinifera]